ncbi:MAG: hypothetical protein C4536_04890 [Actinobacteria bacterium]|jgi:hypothetical protein|nr:MAG: hypothetical protein C4536_04890 [Actinomycetota bacterium]
MNYLASAFYIVGPLAVGALLLLLMVLGKRLGEALELPAYYRLYYVSLVFFLLPLPVAWILLLTKAWGLPDPVSDTGLIIKIAVASIPMAIAITFAVYATAKYWGWIWSELGRSRGKDEGQDES